MQNNGGKNDESITCKACVKKGVCALGGTVNDFFEIAGDYDGFVFGTPVPFGAGEER